jgi:hypothetical protein
LGRLLGARMKPSELLRRAAVRISPVGAWCQGSAAVDEDGDEVPTESESACRWCMAGALMAEGSPIGPQPEDDFIDRVLGFVGCGDARYVDWNDEDDREQSEVIDVFLRAADLAESEGQ